MSRTLYIMRAGLPPKGKRWSLVFRSHDLGGTDYEHIAYLDDGAAYEMVEISHGRINWLFGEPDPAQLMKEDALERAQDLEKQAQGLREKYK